MTKERRNQYMEDMHRDFMQRAIAHGAGEQGAKELADFLVDKTDFSFRNGIKYAKERGWTAEREAVTAQ